MLLGLAFFDFGVTVSPFGEGVGVALLHPTITAINGICFGGGCELALTTSFRLASTQAQIGLPENQARHLSRLGGDGAPSSFNRLLISMKSRIASCPPWLRVSRFVMMRSTVSTVGVIARSHFQNYWGRPSAINLPARPRPLWSLH